MRRLKHIVDISDCKKWLMGIGRHIIIRKVWDTLVLTMTCLPWHYLRMIWKKNWGKISKLPDFKQKQQKKQILRHMPLLRHIMPALNKTQIHGPFAALTLWDFMTLWKAIWTHTLGRADPSRKKMAKSIIEQARVLRRAFLLYYLVSRGILTYNKFLRSLRQKFRFVMWLFVLFLKICCKTVN